MTCRPSARIVRLGGCTTAQLRGMALQPQIAWPDSYVNSGADYSVDFSGLLNCGDQIVQAAFSVTGGVLGWGGSPTYTKSIASAWINWTMVGPQTVTVTVLTIRDVSLTAVVSIVIGNPAALIAVSAPAVAPNVLTLPDGTPLVSEAGRTLLAQ